MNASMKTRSQGRFDALHHLLKVVVPTLPRASHVQVLITCWIHAHTVEGDVQEFHAVTLDMELHAADAESYLHGL